MPPRFAFTVRANLRTAATRSSFESPARLCSVSCASTPRSRSEEHTSELQSHVNLVCRLLLEKKKLTEHEWETGQHYADAKTEVVKQILGRATGTPRR